MNPNHRWSSIPGVVYPGHKRWEEVPGVTYPVAPHVSRKEARAEGKKCDTVKLKDPRSLEMAKCAADMMAGGLSMAESARRIGIAPDTLAYHLKHHGVKIIKHPAEKPISNAVLAAIIRRMDSKESTRKQEAARLGLAATTLKEKLRRFRESQSMKEAA